MGFIQAKQASQDADFGSISATFDTPVSSGSMVFVALSHGGAAASWFSVLDDKSNSYTFIRNTRDATNSQDLTTYYFLNATNGPVTVTASLEPTTRTFRRIAIAEYSGIATTLALDGSNENASLTGSNATDGVVSGSISPSLNGATVIGAVMDTGGVATITEGTNFAERSDLGGLQIEDLVQGAAAPIQATWTFSAANAYVAHIAAFKSAAGAVADTQTRRYQIRRSRMTSW